MSIATPAGWPRRLLVAGLLTAVVDGLFSSVLSAAFYGSTVAKLWQGVASTVLGPSAMTGGAAIYGPCVWLAMSLIVIPLLVQRPPAITYRWWVQLIGHVPFVGLPIVWGTMRAPRRS